MIASLHACLPAFACCIINYIQTRRCTASSGIIRTSKLSPLSHLPTAPISKIQNCPAHILRIFQTFCFLFSQRRRVREMEHSAIIEIRREQVPPNPATFLQPPTSATFLQPPTSAFRSAQISLFHLPQSCKL